MSKNKIRVIFGKKAFAGILTAGLCVLGAANVFAAGTVSVTASKANASVSEQITVNVQTSQPEDPATPPQISVNYDPAVLQFDSCDVEYGGGEGGLVTLTGTGGNITFTALSAGSASINAEAIIDDDGNNPATGSASVTVGDGAAAEADTAAAGAAATKATLKGLAIDPGVLSPAFTPENTQYTITIPEGVTDITVSGGVSDPSSQITQATGFKGLGDGESQAVIIVTAADGSTLEYHFNVVHGDVEAAKAALSAEEATTPETQSTEQTEAAETPAGSMSAGAGLGTDAITSNNMTILIGQNSYTIQPVIPDDMVPEGATKTSITYADQNIEAITLSGGALTLVTAKSSTDGSDKLFLYDASQNTFQGFVTIMAANGSYIVPVALPASLPDGFVVEGTEIGGSYITCGKLKDSSVQQRENVCLLYAMDQDQNQDYYLYDLSGGGYVHFLNTGSSYGAAKGFSKRAIAIIALLAVMLFISIIIMLVMALKRGEDVTLLDEEEPEEPIEEDLFEKPRKKKVARIEPEEEPQAPARSTVKKKKRPVVKEVVEDPYDEDVEPEYDDDMEEEPIRKPAPRKKKTVKTEVEELAEKSMPEPTVKKVKRAPRPAAEEAPESEQEAAPQPAPTVKKVKAPRPEKPVYTEETDDDFDIDREISAMKEKAVQKNATARIANVEANLKKQGVTRTVMPEGSEAAVRPKKPVKRPESKNGKTIRPQTGESGQARVKVTKKVTEKGVTYTTGKIPITVVEAEKSQDAERSSVPIFTLGDDE
ncbi:MAG: hypothetical protein K5739_02635 [Lachnospiraceae bacterium]|nr:hypothetical protein [Lachnospiraceae bacterium]